MKNIKDRFVIADLHLGHENIINFKRKDGITKLRSFTSMEEMHQTIVTNWNRTIKPSDTVYVLGDVVINKKKGFNVLHQLVGRKILVGGNHDLEDAKDYLEVFADVRGVVVFANTCVLTHVPVHPDCLERPSWGHFNIHGHLHEHKVLDKFGNPDARYQCVSCEHVNYTPVRLTEILEKRN